MQIMAEVDASVSTPETNDNGSASPNA